MDARMQPPMLDPVAAEPMALHALHRASLGGDGTSMEPAWAMALTANFGSVERWREQFTAGVQARCGDVGWMLLVFQPREGTLVNHWAAGREQKPADGEPILALGMREQVHRLDDRAAAVHAHVAAFMAHIDWAGVYARYQAAVHRASEPFGAEPDEVRGQPLLDVRRAGVYAQASQMIEGARWCDPAQVACWAGELPADRELIVYCVYGHEVGRATALRLRAAGVQARFLRGGIEGWKAAGRPLSAKPPRAS